MKIMKRTASIANIHASTLVYMDVLVLYISPLYICICKRVGYIYVHVLSLQHPGLKSPR